MGASQGRDNIFTTLHCADCSTSKDSNAGLVCGGDDGCGVEEKRLACFDGETGCTCGLHGANGRDTDDGNIEAHVLVGFGDFDDGEGAAKGGWGWVCWAGAGCACNVQSAEEFAGAGDGGVGAFHGLDGDRPGRR